ncbi:MAG: hypothetical protein PVG99_05605 [Desulfobacteraceae bacterium]
MIGHNPDDQAGKKRMVPLRQVRRVILLSLLLLLWSAPGCLPPPYRAHPEFETRVKKINALALVPPVVKIYELTPSGVVELRDDWCAIGKASLEDAFLEAFKARHYPIRPLRADAGVKEEMEQIRALFKLVNKSVQLHSYGPQVFPEKIGHFEYSLGSVERVVTACETDSIVFVFGFDQVSAQRPKTYVSVAVVDSSGTILWYCVKGSRGEHELRDPISTAMLVEDILSSFPKRVE